MGSRDPSPFDYVAYDQFAQAEQAHIKEIVMGLSESIKEIGVIAMSHSTLEQAGTHQSLIDWKKQAQLKLEEFYMCVGKAIRDDQILRNGHAPLQEGRNNG